MVVQGSAQPTQNEMDSLLKAQRALAINFETPVSDLLPELQGKTLLVTGGASGFGETFATAFAQQPDTAVIIADLDNVKGEQLEKTLNGSGCRVKYIQVDVTDWESVTSLFRNALTWLNTLQPGRSIDHVICSAGVESDELDLAPVNPEDFLSSPTETTSKPPRTLSVRVSVIGSMHTVSAAMKYGMGLHRPDSEIGDKSITLFASLAGYTGMSYRSDYTASKWGVRGLFRSLLDDTKAASCPVRINQVAPYFVATPLTAHRLPQLQKAGIKLADIKDVQAAALRLMSDKRVHGRAVGVWQGGPVDLGDDFGGSFGQEALRKGVESGALVQGTVHLSKQRARM